MSRTLLLSGILIALARPAPAIEMFTNFDNGTQIGLPPMQVPVGAYPGFRPGMPPPAGGYAYQWGYRGDEFGYKWFSPGAPYGFLGHAGFGHLTYGNCPQCKAGTWSTYFSEMHCATCGKRLHRHRGGYVSCGCPASVGAARPVMPPDAAAAEPPPTPLDEPANP
jgi:phage FluMu protein Com